MVFLENHTIAPKHVENDGRLHVDRPKVKGFTPYLVGMLKTMIAIVGHHWRVNNCIFTCARTLDMKN